MTVNWATVFVTDLIFFEAAFAASSTVSTVNVFFANTFPYATTAGHCARRPCLPVLPEAVYRANLIDAGLVALEGTWVAVLATQLGLLPDASPTGAGAIATGHWTT